MKSNIKINSARKRTIRHHFNIIEVTLTVALLAFGFASIMGLFSVAVKSSRSANVINVSSDVVEQFIGFLTNFAKSSATNYTALFDALPDESPATGGDNAPLSRFDSVSGKDKDDNPIYNAARGTELSIEALKAVLESTANPVFFSDNIYEYSENGAKGYYFYINHKAGDKNDYDFTICFYVWKSPTPALNLKEEAGTESLTFDDTKPYTSESEPGSEESKDKWNRLNIEASWPLDVPYNKRETKRYYIDIPRP